MALIVFLRGINVGGRHMRTLVAETELPIWNPLDDPRSVARVGGLADSAGSRWRPPRQSLGVFRWLALAKCSLRALGITHLSCYGLLVLFREKCNKQGPRARFLSENAFSVYVFHPPILIAAALLLHGLTWHPILKFVVLTSIAAGASFVLSAAVFRRTPLLQRII